LRPVTANAALKQYNQFFKNVNKKINLLRQILMDRVQWVCCEINELFKEFIRISPKHKLRNKMMISIRKEIFHEFKKTVFER